MAHFADAVASPSSAARPGRGLNVALWIVQGLVALVFVAAGGMKLVTPIAVLAAKMPWVADQPWLVRFIGVSELAGALGLILPSATRIAPRLTGAAAVGLVTVMVLAAGYHVTHHELANLPANFILGALAGFVAWGRLKRAPIAPRG